MNRFSTAETSQDQGHNIIFNLSCSISEQASQIVAAIKLCQSVHNAERCCNVLSTGEILSEEILYGEGGETGTGCSEGW